jgi:hypothetical protein
MVLVLCICLSNQIKFMTKSDTKPRTEKFKKKRHCCETAYSNAKSLCIHEWKTILCTNVEIKSVNHEWNYMCKIDINMWVFPTKKFGYNGIFCMVNYISCKCTSVQLSHGSNRIFEQKSFWSNVIWETIFLVKCPTGQMSSEQMSFWVMALLVKYTYWGTSYGHLSLLANVFLVKCLYRQMYVWANVLMDKCLYGYMASGQKTLGQVSLWQMSF